MTARFFPYRPRTLRVLLACCGTISAASASVALVHAAAGARWAAVRGVLALALTAGFAWLAWRLRPRAEYGVRLDLAGIALSRPLDGAVERIPWTHVARVEPGAGWAGGWVLHLSDETRRELPRVLFATPAAARDLGSALAARGLPPGPQA